MYFSLQNFSRRQIFILSVVFTALFYLFEAMVFGLYRDSAIQYYAYVLKTDFWLKYLAISIVFWLFSMASLITFVYLSFISSLFFRAIYFFLFSLIIIFNYGYQSVYARFPITADLKIAFLTTSAQQFDAASAYFNRLALIPCIIYLILLVTANRNNRASFKNSAARLTAFLSVVSFFYLAIFFVAPRVSIYNFYDSSFGTGSRVFYSHIFLKISSLPDQRQKVSMPENKVAAGNNIIVIADESTRGDHLSLNGYERPTTPFLESLHRQGLLNNWGIASSGSTRSLESFQYLMTGITADSLTDIAKKVQEMPTLFQYAKAMGYKTYYFDGQLNEYWGGNSEDLKAIDSVTGVGNINPQGEPDYDNDFKIARRVNQIISESAGNFIFIFKHGNHTPYNANFPPENAVWKPFSDTDPPFQNADFDQKTLVNAYDNGINYNLDRFFETLAPDYTKLPNNTVMIYTGDHGQTLSENGENYSHGKNTVREAAVPLFVIGDLKTKVDTDYKAAHANIFATVLDLMNYPSDLRNYQYAPSLLKAVGADSEDRFFLVPNNGNGLVYDKNLRVKFDWSGK